MSIEAKTFRTAAIDGAESPQPGHERPICDVRAMSARPSCVDGSELARTFFTLQAWSVQPCVRPLNAVHTTAGHNALRGSGPEQLRAFDNA